MTRQSPPSCPCARTPGSEAALLAAPLSRQTTIPALLFVEPGLADRVSARLDGAFDRARRLVADHKVELLALANALVRRGTLEGSEIAALVETASLSQSS